MSQRHVGTLPPRYTFMLNPHGFERLSRCPKCRKPTFPRKFALLIHIDDFGAMTLGKTCKYCSKCEMIMCHQDELEAELTHSCELRAPEVLGRAYFVIGTIERKTWKAGLAGEPVTHENLLSHTAEFRKQLGLSLIPRGWYHANHKPKPLPAHRRQRIEWPQSIPR